MRFLVYDAYHNENVEFDTLAQVESWVTDAASNRGDTADCVVEELTVYEIARQVDFSAETKVTFVDHNPLPTVAVREFPEPLPRESARQYLARIS